MELNERLNYESLLELCREYKEDIKARKKLPGVLGNRKVRYIDQEGHFGYTQFGDFYFTSMGVMMLITTDNDLTWYHMPDEMSLDMDKGLLTQALAKIANRIGNEEKVLEEGL